MARDHSLAPSRRAERRALAAAFLHAQRTAVVWLGSLRPDSDARSRFLTVSTPITTTLDAAMVRFPRFVVNGAGLHYVWVDGDGLHVETFHRADDDLSLDDIVAVDAVPQPQERQFSDGVPLPVHTFLLWTDEDRAPKHIHITAVSFEAALSILEGWLVARSIVPLRVTHIDRGTLPESPLGRTRFVRTVGGYAPLAA